MTSIFPHWGRPTGPDSAGVTTRRYAWQWVLYRVREKTDRPDGEQHDLADAIKYIHVEVRRK